MNKQNANQRKGTQIWMEQTAPRQVEAYRLRYEEGRTYDEVATILGYSGPAAAYNAVKAAFKYYNQERAEIVAESKNAAAGRIKQKIWDLEQRLGKPSKSVVMGKNNEVKAVTIIDEDLSIIDRIIKLEELLAKIEGTITPPINQTNVQVNNNMPSFEEIIQQLE